MSNQEKVGIVLSIGAGLLLLYFLAKRVKAATILKITNFVATATNITYGTTIRFQADIVNQTNQAITARVELWDKDNNLLYMSQIATIPSLGTVEEEFTFTPPVTTTFSYQVKDDIHNTLLDYHDVLITVT